MVPHYVRFRKYGSHFWGGGGGLEEISNSWCAEIYKLNLCTSQAHRWQTCSGRSRIFEREFQTKTPAQFELKTKKKVINLHTSLLAVFYIYYWMISNKTTVIRASQSDCSIDLTALLEYMNFIRGFRGNLKTRHWHGIHNIVLKQWV